MKLFKNVSNSLNKFGVLHSFGYCLLAVCLQLLSEFCTFNVFLTLHCFRCCFV